MTVDELRARLDELSRDGAGGLAVYHYGMDDFPMEILSAERLVINIAHGKPGLVVALEDCSL